MLFDRTFKVVFLGDWVEGNTKFIQSAPRVTKVFEGESRMVTIGVEFYTKEMFFEGKRVKLQIWNCTDADRFRFLLPSYCKESKGGFFVYDVTNPQSLRDIDLWINILRQQAGQIPLLIVGTKINANKTSKVTRDEILFVANKYSISEVLEIPAITGNSVEPLFLALTKLMLEKNELVI